MDTQKAGKGARRPHTNVDTKTDTPENLPITLPKVCNKHKSRQAKKIEKK